MATTLDSKVPSGPLEKKWDKHRGESKLVAPNNRPKFNIIVVGSGLAGASAAATLGELGYNVQCFCFQDSPRRAHSIAAQGGINAAIDGITKRAKTVGWERPRSVNVKELQDW